jgi:hypothetical protein
MILMMMVINSMYLFSRKVGKEKTDKFENRKRGPAQRSEGFSKRSREDRSSTFSSHRYSHTFDKLSNLLYVNRPPVTVTVTVTAAQRLQPRIRRLFSATIASRNNRCHEKPAKHKPLPVLTDLPPTKQNFLSSEGPEALR